MNEVRIDAILFESLDPEKLVAFYQEAFGLGELKRFGDDHLGLGLPNGYLGFERVTEDGPDRRGAVSIWFKVDDVRDAYRRLLELGAREKSAPDAECSPGATLARVYDPDGNVVGLIGPA